MKSGVRRTGRNKTWLAGLGIALLTWGVIGASGLRGPTAASAARTGATDDGKPPGLVTDLSSGIRTPSSITLTWTAPGDDGDRGHATAYDLRWATSNITEESWIRATPVDDEPIPARAGTRETMTVTGLPPGATCWFALKTRDEGPAHWSPLSRVCKAATPPESGRMVSIMPGSFEMGSPRGEPDRHERERRHRVTLTRPFRISDHEVTQGEWREVMGTNPAEFKGDDDRPVELVSWFDALDYCNRRSMKELLKPAYAVDDTSVSWDLTADGYRLPTEAEWEYACRAGTASAFASGRMTAARCAPLDPGLDAMGWYCGNAGSEAHRERGLTEAGVPYDMSHAVRQKAANAWGLFDMHGNVNEWCWDYLADYPGGIIDPIGPSAGVFRVLRGGSRFYNAAACRSASRTGAQPGSRSSLIGFRVAQSVGWPPAP